MDELRIESQGFRVGRWCFPPFRLRSGECVTISFPTEALAEEDRILACLTGAAPVAGLTLPGKIVFARRATAPFGWRSWLGNPTPFHWLKRNTTLADDAIRSIVAKHGMDGPVPVSRYAGNQRAILGLYAAYAQNPEVVVFSTTALDPTGVRAMKQIVADRLPTCAAVYLAWPYTCQGKVQVDAFPGFLSVSVFEESLSPNREAVAAAKAFG